MRANVGVCRRAFACLLAGPIAIGLLVAPAPASASDCPNADAQAAQAPPTVLEQATLCLLNDERAANGLGALASSPLLAVTAERYAAHMVVTGRFAHVDENGGTVIDRVIADDPLAGTRWDGLGENLGWGTFALATPRAMVTGWMNSQEHRDNILYPGFDHIGVGIASGAPAVGAPSGAALTYVTVFGRLTPPPASVRQKAKPHRSKHRRRAHGARRRHSRTAAERRR